jgi:hypothetical protein
MVGVYYPNAGISYVDIHIFLFLKRNNLSERCELVKILVDSPCCPAATEVDFALCDVTFQSAKITCRSEGVPNS